MISDREKQGKLEEYLRKEVDSPQVKALVELLALRREGYRTKLESSEEGENRGKAQECSGLLKIFVK